MDRQEIRETPIWELYERGQNYHRLTGIYEDTDRNHNFYNGNQWEGAQLGGIEPTQDNVIKPIVKYKLSVIHSNLYAINYSSQNFENPSFRKNADRYCKILNRYASNIWERDQMDKKFRSVTKDAAINDEGVLYVSFDKEKMLPVNEVIDKCDIYYGNENDEDIQSQPYILIRKRMPVVNARDLAISEGVSEEKAKYIIGDTETFEEAGEAAKDEIDNGVTVVYKFYKRNGTVYYSVATRYCEIAEEQDTGLTLYPIAHMVWEEKKGSARGEGEVRYLIPNQIEINRTLMRRILTAKKTAYPFSVVDTSKISNPDDLDNVGGVIKTNGTPVDDVHKIVSVIPPAQMSPDAKQLQDELIQVTRDLAGAGETATGQVDPESASGRAILAVQQASQAPITENKERFKTLIEDTGRIWLDFLIVHSEGGVSLEEEITDENTGEKTVQLVNVPQSALEQLRAAVKIEVTPKGPYDKYAQEMSLENLLNGGYFGQRMPELKIYVKLLDDDSVMPKAKLEQAIEEYDKEQMRIAVMNAQAQIMQQNASQFIMGDPDSQAQQIADARRQLEAQKALEAEEAKYAEKEAELDEETAEAEEDIEEE